MAASGVHRGVCSERMTTRAAACTMRFRPTPPGSCTVWRRR